MTKSLKRRESQDWTMLRPQIEKLVNAQLTTKEIAEKLGVDTECLREALRRWGLIARRQMGWQNVTVTELELIREWMKEGISKGQAALRLKRDKKTIHMACIHNGIDPNGFADARSRPWNDDELMKLKQMREDGVHYREMAVTLRRGINTVKEKLRAMGLESEWSKKLAYHRELAANGEKMCYVCHTVKPMTAYRPDSKHCMDCSEIVKKKQTNRLKDNQDINRILNHRLRGAAERARKYEWGFDIDLLYMVDLYNTQKGKCYYTGRMLSLSVGDADTVSIDRLDSSLGYLKGNVVLCGKKVNLAKVDMSVREFENMIRAIHQHRCLDINPSTDDKETGQREQDG